MNTKYYKLLHSVLIILLVLAPLRSVFATQFVVCDMNSSTEAASVDVDLSAKHCQYMIDSSSVDEGIEYQNVAKSCCGDDGACSSDCHIAVSISMLMQDADYSSVLLGAVTFDGISNTLLVRELVPPSRPPLLLYS